MSPCRSTCQRGMAIWADEGQLMSWIANQEQKQIVQISLPAESSREYSRVKTEEVEEK